MEAGQRQNAKLRGGGATVLADREIGTAEARLDVDSRSLGVDRGHGPRVRSVDVIDDVLNRLGAGEADVVRLAAGINLDAGRVERSSAPAAESGGCRRIDQASAGSGGAGVVLRIQAGAEQRADRRIVVQRVDDVVGRGFAGRDLKHQGAVARVVSDGLISFGDGRIVDERNGDAVGARAHLIGLG